VLVLRHVRDRAGAGGAANVARNLRALGSRVRVLGVVGRDEAGSGLLELLEDDPIDTSGVLALDGYDTPTKTRVLAAEPRRPLQQILRVDREPAWPIGGARARSRRRGLRAIAGSLDAVVSSDYGYGLVAGEIGAAARELAAGCRPRARGNRPVGRAGPAGCGGQPERADGDDAQPRGAGPPHEPPGPAP
jgi:bifunctional ADP-heptose synthase (sugar kinase/adenylyltransferase)